MDGIIPGVRLAACSRLYHSSPWGPPDQPWYANMVAALACEAAVTPETLFSALACLERELGRDRTMARRFGPRVLDVDLLDFAGQTRTGPDLTLPHPRMAQRAFVLVPLAEIAPGFRLADGCTALEGLGRLSFACANTIIVQAGSQGRAAAPLCACGP